MTENIEQELVTNRFYPSEAFIWEIGKAVYEYPFIEKTDKGIYIIHIQRHFPWDPFTRAEFREWDFDNVRDAIAKYTNLKNGIF